MSHGRILSTDRCYRGLTLLRTLAIAIHISYISTSDNSAAGAWKDVRKSYK
ncbi:unnamed protein product [Brugia pahangi]|uniref:Transposase n=1 Tax=Brugia pahangi TaxID=6280 RepID=A0A0N4T7X5_BRUPA|nr:unnamed protein product [Brugia pahangi]